MIERPRKIEPPLVIEVDAPSRTIEFYVDLSSATPELDLLELIHGYLADKAPLTLVSLVFNYQPATDENPALLIGTLTAGAYLDLG